MSSVEFDAGSYQKVSNEIPIDPFCVGCGGKKQKAKKILALAFQLDEFQPIHDN